MKKNPVYVGMLVRDNKKRDWEVLHVGHHYGHLRRVNTNARRKQFFALKTITTGLEKKTWEELFTAEDIKEIG